MPLNVDKNNYNISFASSGNVNNNGDDYFFNYPLGLSAVSFQHRHIRFELVVTLILVPISLLLFLTLRYSLRQKRPTNNELHS